MLNDKCFERQEVNLEDVINEASNTGVCRIDSIDWNYSNQLNSPREQSSFFNSDLSASVESAAL